MSLLGFLNLDDSNALESLQGVLPADVYLLITKILSEINWGRSISLLSVSLFFTVYNSSSGFRTAMFFFNKAYEIEDKRGFFTKLGVSLVLMSIFALSLIVMLVIFIFGSIIWYFISINLPASYDKIFYYSSTAVSLFLLVFTTMSIYKLANVRKLRWVEVLPGSCITVAIWMIASNLFSFCIANFTNYSLVYGSSAGVFILIIWLNLISLILLMGNEINAFFVLNKRYKEPTSNIH